MYEDMMLKLAEEIELEECPELFDDPEGSILPDIW